MTQPLLLTNIKQLAGIQDAGVEILRGPSLSAMPSLQNAWLLLQEGLIHSFGTMDQLSQVLPSVPAIDCSGQLVLPAFCDSHTHLVFAATREKELIYKLQGMSYAEIAARGGGILQSAEKLQQASEDLLFEQALERLHGLVKQGTGAVEIKSGYGLSLESELKMLRVIRRLREKNVIPVRATFLGAHAIPHAYKNNREGYLRLIIQEMIPSVAKEQLADYIDVFCDQGFFTVEETGRILDAGLEYGLKAKIHANQLAVSGGVQCGIAHGAISVDHLESVGEEEIAALASSGTIPTLLPSAAFYLRMAYPPARRMIEAGLPVTLASDFNPGSSPSGRMSFVVSLACIGMKMMPEEALNAATLNGAAAMELNTVTGSITAGKMANLVITQPADDLAAIPYSFGNDLIDRVIIQGKLQ